MMSVLCCLPLPLLLLHMQTDGSLVVQSHSIAAGRIRYNSHKPIIRVYRASADLAQIEYNIKSDTDTELYYNGLENAAAVLDYDDDVLHQITYLLKYINNVLLC